MVRVEIRTKETGDVHLAQIIFEAIGDSKAGEVLVQLDEQGTGFIMKYTAERDDERVIN